MQRITLTTTNKLGLHARASAKLTQLASSFASQAWLTHGERRVNAKSIMGVMMLAASMGSTLVLEANGPDEEELLQAIQALFSDKFGEKE
jgi:phosphocarrier protein HPr